MPGTRLGQLRYGPVEQFTPFTRLTQEQMRHAAVEQGRDAFAEGLPLPQRVFGVATVPGQGGLFVGGERLPRGAAIGGEDITWHCGAGGSTMARMSPADVRA